MCTLSELWCKRPIYTREFIFAQIASNKVMGSPSSSGVNTPSSRDCAHRRGLIPNASCRTGGGHGVRVHFCLGGLEVGSGISTARGADSSPGTARCKLVWCTEPYKGTILYVEFSSSHTRAGLDSIDFRTISVAEAARRGLSKGESRLLQQRTA